jgi:N utilization substance protein A
MANTINSFTSAIDEICEEKGLKKEVIFEAVEAAIAAAYRKDYGKPKQVMKAKIDPVTGSADIFRVYEVVGSDEEIEETERQLTLTDAKKLDKKVEAGGEVLVPMPKEESFGRIAAQTAKQVIIQRLREAERDMVFAEYKDKEGTILNASVQQIDGRNIIVSLGKANGILFPSDQIRDEKYYVGQRLKAFLKEVSSTARGPQMLVSRTDEGLIRGLFESEVPEISTGTVEIKSIAREAGSRTKIAVIATEEGIDPVGSCVGQRGTRVQAILAELADEKIDIVLWDEDAEQFIMNALSPAKTEQISISSKDHKATVAVSKENLSLAIGKGGQNVRLASKLTGWGIDIVQTEDAGEAAKSDTRKDEGDDAEPDLSESEGAAGSKNDEPTAKKAGKR